MRVSPARRSAFGRSVVALMGASLLAACAGTPSGSGSAVPPAAVSPPPLVATAPPADISSVERYAWLGVVQMGEDFAAGNADAFLARVSHGFYRGFPALEASLRSLFAATTGRSVVVAVREVIADGDRVSVRAEWSRQLQRAGGAPEQVRGETTFLFLRSETSLRLLDYRGAPPFGIEGI